MPCAVHEFEGYRKFISTPLGPERGLKRHDLQESDVRHCLSRWGLREAAPHGSFTYSCIPSLQRASRSAHNVNVSNVTV